MAEQISNSTIARAKAGDDAALTAIYELYLPKIQRFLYYRVGDRHAAEDLTTEVFLRVIGNIGQYRIQAAPLQAWIFQIARNIAIDHFRRQGVRNHLELDSRLAANGDGPDTIAARSLLCDQLRGALEQLTEGQADVVILRFISGLSISETARTLDKSESAVKALQARGLEALHRILSNHMVAYERIT